MKSIDGLTKTKILGYFKKHKLDDIYIDDFIETVNYKRAKYNDLDILNYLCDTLKDAIENKTQTDNMIQKLVLLIYGIFGNLVLSKKAIRDDLYDKVLEAQVLFNEYFDGNNIVKNDYVVKYLDNVNKLLETSSQKELDEEEVNEDGSIKNDDDTLSSETVEIKDEQDTKTVKELESKIKKLEKEAEKYKNKTQEKREKIKELNKTIKELNEQIKELEKKLTKQESTNLSLNEKINNLSEKLETLEKEINEAAQVLEENKTKNLSLLLSNEYVTGQRKLYEDKIDNDILGLIFCKACSIYEIRQVYPDYTYEEIQESLVRISEKYKIEPQDVVIPRKFKVQKLSPETNKKLTLKANASQSIDIMFISDLHIDDSNLELVSRRLDKVYDYCTVKGISTVINLGDLIDQEFSSVNSYEQNNNVTMLLDNIINNFPSSPSVNHVILGGNHDDRILYYGVDPLKYIAIRRDDIINLGYYTALLEFNCNETSEYLMLHHKGLPTENYNYQDAEQLLKGYDQAIRSKETNAEIYMHLFGHLHRSRIDPQNKYAIVQSLVRGDEYEIGALHAKVYLDVLGNISNILFIPLAYENGLKKVAEIPYTKVKKYK